MVDEEEAEKQKEEENKERVPRQNSGMACLRVECIFAMYCSFSPGANRSTYGRAAAEPRS